MSGKINWFDNVEHRRHPGPGLNWLTTALCVPDAGAAATFHTEVMTMAALSEPEDGAGQLPFARMRDRGINFTIDREVGIPTLAAS